MLLRTLAAGVLLGAVPAVAFAADRPVVVELFTSEGCSSCPPADAFLTDLARGRSDVLPLAFHVTYWNSLGWKDPFSTATATQRQARFGAKFGDGSYTPELVVDGRKGLVGSERGAAEAVIAAASGAKHTAALMTLRRQAAGLSIEVGEGTGSGRVVLVGFDPEHRTAVGRGENSGRTLIESNIVRSVRALAQWTGASLTLAAEMPDGQDAAVLLEAPDGSIIGAARLR
jgi:hypothetical protein